MRWLEPLLLLVALAAPQAASSPVADGTPTSNSSDSPILAVHLAASLPANVPDDFWTATKPPSAAVKREDNIAFEFLHCDGLWDEKDARAKGSCHYLAGEVARFSQLHLHMPGTFTVVGTCGLADKITMGDGARYARWHPTIQREKLKNGLCVYDTPARTVYLRVSN